MQHFHVTFQFGNTSEDLIDYFFLETSPLGSWQDSDPQRIDAGLNTQEISLDSTESSGDTLSIWQLGTYHAVYRTDQSLELFRETMAALLSDFGATFEVNAELTGIAEVPDENWAVKWQEGFPPLPVGEKFLICAPWNKRNEEGRFTIIIEPGLAFGTGLHETTQHCIELLEQVSLHDRIVLDVGSGSGVLSIASRFLGAAHVTGVELETAAVCEATRNAELSSLPAPALTFGHPDDVSPRPDTNLLVANMLWREHQMALPQVISSCPLISEAIIGGIGLDLTDAATKFFSDHKFTVRTSLRGELFQAFHFTRTAS